MLDFSILPRFKSFSFMIVCQIPVWASIYEVEPHEIMRQVQIAHAWWINNPKRGPRKDVMRFLNNWMSLADRKGSMHRYVLESQQIKPRDPEPQMTYEEMVEIRRKNLR